MGQPEAAPFDEKTVPVIVNSTAGTGHSTEDLDKLRELFHEQGLVAEVIGPEAGETLPERIARVMRSKPRVVVAAGGDGTINAVASAVRGTATVMGILPMGTLNHFAKDVGIPLDLAEAVRVVANGTQVAIDVGEVNGTPFLNNSSLGLYPGIVRDRTRQQRRLGRSKWMAMLRAIVAVVPRSRLLNLRLEMDGREQRCRSTFVFIGNNEYVMEGFDIGSRERLDCGRLSVYTTQRSSFGGLIGLALRALTKRLHQAEDFVMFQAHRLRIETPHKRLLVATDGEVNVMDTPLEYRILPRSLQVIAPAKG